MLSGIAALVSKTAAAPIERIKLLRQNQDELLRANRISTPYKGILDCASRVIKQEGIFSLWKGNFANVLRYFPTQGLNFMFRGYFKKTFKRSKENGYFLWFLSNLASGGAAGASSLVFVYSLDYARTRLANDVASAKEGGNRKFHGLVDVYKKTVASDGIKGLYRGFGISCVGIIVYRGCYFGFYDTLKALILPDSQQENFLLNFCVGYGSTVAAGYMSYPLDTVRRRMMMTSGEKVHYRSSLQATKQIIQDEGALSLYKGAGANVLRGVAGAGVLSVFDKLKEIYISNKP